MQIKKSPSIILLVILFALVTAQQVFAVLMIDTVAGNGTAGYSGDGGAATSAQLNLAYGVTVDSSGNIYIADRNNQRIRKVNTSGIISTVAGTGTAGYSGDGGAATSAQLNNPYGVTVDSSGNIYIADRNNQRIRKVNTSGIISTVAGNGASGYSGDGGTATAAQLNNPYGVTVDSIGNIYIADRSNQRIRKVNTSGIISTVAGTGTAGYSGDGGTATAAQLYYPTGIDLDSTGHIFITDSGNYRIRKINTSGIITTVAGTGTLGYSGDGGAATSAQLSSPSGVTVDSTGNIFIADSGNHRIRKINTSGIITTVAGTGTLGYSGDGGAATSAQIRTPSDVTVDSSGNIFIADYGNYRIRKAYDVIYCASGCVNGQCVTGDVCQCDAGYTGTTCDQPICSSPCVNGTCIAPDTCSCNTGYTGAVCDQPICEPACINGDCTAPNTCACDAGYSGSVCNQPVCDPACVHGSCVAPDLCQCDEGYQGDTCEETPTIVTLSSFTATAKAGRVTLEWTTESEIDNVGFNIYRAASEDGEYVKINRYLIPAQGSATQGASYRIIDKDVKNRKTYYYKLEDIDLNGKSTFHEPVSATPRLMYRYRK